MIVQYSPNFNDEDWQYRVSPFQQLQDVTHIGVRWGNTQLPRFTDKATVELFATYAPDDGHPPSQHQITFSQDLLRDCVWDALLGHVAAVFAEERDNLILQSL